MYYHIFFNPDFIHIIKNNISINIDGRAGTGKSTFIKQLQQQGYTLKTNREDKDAEKNK